jgi:putative membrane protein
MNDRLSDSRRPRWVYGVGSEPDPRFSLANERTFLAWVRTSLALFAGGIALEALKIPAHPGFRLSAGLVLIGLGLLAIVQGWVSWARTERSLRRGVALPGLTVGAVILGGIAVAAVLVLIGLLW